MEDPAIAFNQLPPETREALLNGPGLQPPPGVTPNFEFRPNENAIAHGTMASCVIICTIFICFTVYAKVFHFKKVRFEDYWALASVVGWVVFIAYMYEVTIKYGYFVHQWDFRLREVPDYLYYFAVVIVPYYISIATIKGAIIFQWIRIFVPQGTRNAFFWVGQAIVWLNFIASMIMMFMVIFACNPREKFWNPLIPGTCLNALATVYIAPIINLVFDTVALILPQKVIWSLRLSWRKKLGVSVLFALGILACLSAGLRIGVSITFATQPDRTYNIGSTELWCIAEMSAGILIYCMPTAPVAIKHLTGKAVLTGSRITGPSSGRAASKNTSTGTSWKASNNQEPKKGIYHEIDEVPLTTIQPATAIASERPRDVEQGPQQDDEGIRRTTHVTTITHQTIADPDDAYMRQHPWDTNRNANGKRWSEV
ncbi:hypothetical protein GGS23DRAFT_544565 [Durotheca rogersii]|uniref:uncharacterized protein n=1 Tax=Durotheca rogersii TaxID=419775 RepID=UPI0022208D41|nr:uncharacterized protein GGS23DRAFT_544565 [Durotheca rogersii]KAI5868215.1 hypothetical protein GGS23DRAFT_544565 [Durotheca rogersii]